jgi:hypothetical protein
MSGNGENGSWKWLVVLAVMAVLLAAGLAVVVNSGAGQAHCDMVSASGGPSCR